MYTIVNERNATIEMPQASLSYINCFLIKAAKNKIIKS